MDTQIRLATIDQASRISEVLLEAFQEYQELYTPEAFAATTPTAAQIQNRWYEGPVWVAVQNDRVVGTVACVPKGKALYIRSMAIVPTSRGRGLGKALLKEVERYARENDFQRMFLSTTLFLHQAINLYVSFGFKQIAGEPHELFETPLYTMEKGLG